MENNNNNNQPKQPKTDLGNPYHDKQGQFSAPKQSNPVNPAPKPNNNKPLKQMGLNEKDLEPADQSPMFKAKQAAMEAGKKGGYDDYSDFDEKGELMARPARTASLLGDTSKFHPDAQVRGIKKFNDGHFEYQLKNPDFEDFKDFRYDDKNGHWQKDLWDFKQKDEARIRNEKNEKEIKENLAKKGVSEEEYKKKMDELSDAQARTKYGSQEWDAATKAKDDYQAQFKNDLNQGNNNSKVLNKMGLEDLKEEDFDPDYVADTKINSSVDKLYNSGALDVSGNIITPDNVKKVYDALNGEYTEDDIISAMENHSSFRKPSEYESKISNQMGLGGEETKQNRKYAETQKYFNDGNGWTNQIGGLTTGLVGNDLKNALNNALTKRGFTNLYVDEHNQQNDNITNFVVTDSEGYKVNGWYDRNSGRLGLEPQSVKSKDDGWYQDKLKDNNNPKYNIGSDKLLSKPEDRSKMEELSKAFKNAGLNTEIKDGWEDYGAGMKWTNLVSGDTWVLSPRDWLDYMNGNTSAEEIVDRVKNGDYSNVFDWNDNNSKVLNQMGLDEKDFGSENKNQTFVITDSEGQEWEVEAGSENEARNKFLQSPASSFGGARRHIVTVNQRNEKTSNQVELDDEDKINDDIYNTVNSNSKWFDDYASKNKIQDEDDFHYMIDQFIDTKLPEQYRNIPDLHDKVVDLFNDMKDWEENGGNYKAALNQMGLGNENSQAEADVKKLLDLTDNKYGITLSNAIDDLKKYPEDSLLGDNKAISQLMNRFGLSKEDVIKALNYKFDGLIS